MSEAPLSTAASGRYLAPENGYDEAAVGTRLRPHWRRLFQRLEPAAGNPDHALTDVARNINQHLSEAAFDSSSTTADRPWQLDALPLLLSEEDWSTLESGLVQRAELLNLILKDFYGSQEILGSGALPPALVFANPDFLLPACQTLAADEALRCLAFDLGRSPDGQWWVLSNRCEAPKGLGYLLENRIVMARCVPELLASENIERLADFYQQLNNAWQQPAADDALTVLLSGGPQSTDYAEQAYLGRYLGLPVIEGDDLTVRSDQLYLKTLDGLQRVRSVVRTIASDLCDPLELRSDSLQGTPGLVNTLRQGQAVISNSLGSGGGRERRGDGLSSRVVRTTARRIAEASEHCNLVVWPAGRAGTCARALRKPGATGCFPQKTAAERERKGLSGQRRHTSNEPSAGASPAGTTAPLCRPGADPAFHCSLL